MEDLYKKYPNLERDRKKVEKRALHTLKLLDALDEKYPVEGWFWYFDGNDQNVCLLKDRT